MLNFLIVTESHGKILHEEAFGQEGHNASLCCAGGSATPAFAWQHCQCLSQNDCAGLVPADSESEANKAKWVNWAMIFL